MKSINVLLAVLVSLAVFAGVFEIGLRLIGKGPTKVLNEFDASVGWVKTPGKKVARKTGEYSVKFQINKHGMRDDLDLGPGKLEGVQRVVCLGDSFTLGYTVPRHDLFVDQLEHWWNEEGRNVELINTGTEGYSTDQQAAWLKEHGKKWKPDLVLLFAYENDIYYNAQTHYARFPKPRFDAGGNPDNAVLEDPGKRGFLAQSAIGNLFAKKKGLDTFEHPAAGGRLISELAPLLLDPPAFVADAVARTEGSFKALARACEALESEVVVVVIPSHSAVDEEYAEVFSQMRLRGMPRNDWDPNRPVELLLEAAQSAGLRTLDPRDAMRTAQSERKTKGEAHDLYFQKDFHLNALGNRVLAEYVHESLPQLGLAPGQAQTVLAAMPTPPKETESRFPTWLGWFLGLWVILSSLFAAYYKKDEKVPLAFLKVGALLATIFGIAIGGAKLLSTLPPGQAKLVFGGAILLLFGFIFYKLGDRLGTITELFGSFVKRGHWYLMPLVMILLSVGSLLVVAASSPLVAPFIYTLF